jgi:HK97 gp10 family phage protein
MWCSVAPLASFMRSDLKFSGGPELERALRELGNEVAGRLGLNAVRAGARVIAADAKRHAPRRTGEYAKSIRTFDDRQLNRLKGRERTAYAGTRDFRGVFLEFGTVKMAARPHFRPAIDSPQQAIDKMKENLGRGIERETAKYRGRRNG